MSTNTGIEWTEATWNPVRGCSRVSEGCRNCYAERMAARFATGPVNKPGPFSPFVGLNGKWNGHVELIEEKLTEPLHWHKPRRVFVNSMSDLFHESLPDEAIDRVFAVMAKCPQHVFQILTKRAERMASFPWRRWRNLGAMPDGDYFAPIIHGEHVASDSPSLPNVWLGVSCEDQKTADERIPLLLQTPAALRFISVEPLLGPVDLTRIEYNPGGSGGGCFINALTGKSVSLCGSQMIPKIDWTIVGGEFGPGARSCRVEWIRSIVDQCRGAGVPCFVKQLGARPRYAADEWTQHWPTVTSGLWFDEEKAYAVPLKSTKGGDPAEWPADLNVREFPR